jgi:hypothetical protein
MGYALLAVVFLVKMNLNAQCKRQHGHNLKVKTLMYIRSYSGGRVILYSAHRYSHWSRPNGTYSKELSSRLLSFC